MSKIKMEEQDIISLKIDTYRIKLGDKLDIQGRYVKPIGRYWNGVLKIHMDKYGREYIKIREDMVIHSYNSSPIRIPHSVPIQIDQAIIVDIPHVQTLIPNDCISNILSFLGRVDRGENMSLIETLGDPLTGIIKYLEFQEGFFDPIMVAGHMPKENQEEWNVIMNKAFYSFLCSRVHIIPYIVRSLRVEEKLSGEIGISACLFNP